MNARPDAFMAHWANTLANDSALTWTVVSDGTVAGNIGCWEADGRRFVGYWIGREFWGRGLATRALAELLDFGRRAPAARVRGEGQPCFDPRAREVRFVEVDSHTGDDGIEELLLELPLIPSHSR